MGRTKKQNNKQISVSTNEQIKDIQDMLYSEMKVFANDDFLDLSESEMKNEFQRSGALYNLANGYVRTINLSLRIVETMSKDDKRTTKIASKLGLNINEK